MKITLKAARVNRDMSQEEAGALIGVSRDSIRRWEKGYSTPKQEYLDKLCNTYGVTYDDLIFLPRFTQNA